MARERILVVDDEEDIREVVRLLLESEGYEVAEAANGRAALALIDEKIDLILLDVMMPGFSGFEACRKIREKTAAPIIFLTAKTLDKDKQQGFAAGGDDYLPKPFSMVELKSRVAAALRRYIVYGSRSEQNRGEIAVKDLIIDTASSHVRRGGETLNLTETEYRILLLLATNRKQVFSVQEIYERVWNESYLYTANSTVMVHVRNLRRKLGDDRESGEIVRTVWGRGYVVD